MRFQAEHRFAAPPPAVADVLVDPAFHRDVELPDVRLLGVVDHRDDGDDALLSLRYQYVGQLDPVVRRLLGDRRLTWVQDLAVARATSVGRLTFAVEGNPQRLHGVARFTLRPDGEQTVWQLEGEVKVRVPLVGASAERRVLGGFLQRLDVEARHVSDRLGGRGDDRSQ